jgi:hypothetical protein
MITTNPIKLNNPITFQGENNNNLPKALIRPLQGPAAGTSFEQKAFEAEAVDNYRLSMEADAVQNNPLRAVFNKFIKAYRLITPPRDGNIDPIIANHIGYMA